VKGWLARLLARHRANKEAAVLDARKWLAGRYQVFRSLLAANNRAVELLTEIAMELRLGLGERSLAPRVLELEGEVAEMISRLEALAPSRYRGLRGRLDAIAQEIDERLSRNSLEGVPLCIDLAEAAAHGSGLAGNKAAVLARLASLAGVRVPPGFVITLAGCRAFLEHDGLILRLSRLLSASATGAEVPRPTLDRVREEILEAELPPGLAEMLALKARPFFEAGQGLAVRSSAVSEDGRVHSYAGQYATVLNVRNQADLARAFREVVASSFNARSVAYRIQAGRDPLEFEMAVLVVEMVDPRCAGILLTREPGRTASDTMVASAVYGLGEAAVAGSGSADILYLDGAGRMDASRSVIAAKERRLVSGGERGVRWELVPEAERTRPVLTPDELAELARLARRLEREMGCPLDIEWALDSQGLVLLQARPLPEGKKSGNTAQRPPDSRRPLVEGVAASLGCGTGRVFKVRGRIPSPEEIDAPVILVMHQSLVDAVAILDRALGVVVELGSPADHLACVARERGVALLCNARGAMERLGDGDWVTVDSGRGAVFPATEQERAGAVSSAAGKERKDIGLSSEKQELAERITALHLTDAYGPTFSVLECRSLHDIVRFIHEKAVISMFEAGDELLERSRLPVHVIDSPVPFVVNLIDLGGGIAPQWAKKKRLPPEGVLSRPFQALWRGVTTPGLSWGPPPGGAAMGSVLSTWITDQKSERPVGMPNYAIVSREYLNLNARMDFHFVMVDALTGMVARSNHLRFRFKGGGTNQVRRERRARAIAEIFSAHGFLVDRKADLVNASFQGAPAEVMDEKLVMVGRILGFTRLLDAAMESEERVAEVVRAFLSGDYALSGCAGSGKPAGQA